MIIIILNFLTGSNYIHLPRSQ